jgi:hypothetical protein
MTQSLFKDYSIIILPLLIVEISIQLLLILKEIYILGEVEEVLIIKVNAVMETTKM